MSSVTMSMTSAGGSSTASPPRRTSTSARPCGRFAASLRMPGRDGGQPVGASSGQVIDRHVPVVRLEADGHVADARQRASAERLPATSRACLLSAVATLALSDISSTPLDTATLPLPAWLQLPGITTSPAVPTAAGSSAAAPAGAGRAHRWSRLSRTWCRSAARPSGRGGPATARRARRGSAGPPRAARGRRGAGGPVRRLTSDCEDLLVIADRQAAERRASRRRHPTAMARRAGQSAGRARPASAPGTCG